jgi:uncharacterized membrane protein YbaN (DUF454 family)
MRRTPVLPTPTRLIYLGLGCCAAALGIAGVVVPGLPTTVFVLAASYFFSRSSPRLERWLRENAWLGPSLRRLTSADGMPRSVKRAALIAMWTAVLLSSGVLAAVHWGLALATIALGVVGTLTILFGVRTAPEALPEASVSDATDR